MEDEDQAAEVQSTKLGKKSRESQHSSDSDSSFSLSPLLLPESVKKDEAGEGEQLSECSSISEHLNSHTSGSVEHDRSDQEIEISNQPSFSPPDDVDHISQEVKPFSSTSSESLNVVEKLDNLSFDVRDRVHSILDEILRSEQFRSDSERTVQRSEFSVDSNENSFNVFGGLNLNDSLINYDAQVRDKNVNSIDHLSLSNRDSLKVKQLEEIVIVKDNTIAALAAELESLKEITSSNQSTLSINTSATEYKMYQDEFQNKIVEYQHALSHRDTLIQQLTEALQQSVVNREQLQQQSIYFSKEIVTLQNQLAKTTELVSNQKWNLSNSDLKNDSLKSTTNTSIQNEDVDQASDEESSDKPVLNFETQCSKLEDTLNSTQINLMNDLKNCVNTYVQQKAVGFKNAHKSQLDKLLEEKMDCENEISRLRKLLTDIKSDSTDIADLRIGLERKHAKEMEELRTYFEKKCADLEKNYSEEVYSEQSRKLSNSSASYEGGDFLFTNPSGPGGDTVQICVDATKYECSDLSKNDVIKLKKNLSAIALDLKKYDVDNISKDDLVAIKLDLNKYDFRSLLKYDLSLIKAEIQNKYHAELEILREDYENRIDALNVENHNHLLSVERKYVDKIESLKFDLDEALRAVDTNVSTAVQEVVSSGEFELAEVVTSYERRLQEQVTMAKIDIINALEQQIQMLVANTAEDAEWPSELLQLRNRFTEEYEDKITKLNNEHEEEITKLKEEHRKILNGALERARRRSLKDDSLTQSDLDIIKERDNLKKSTSILRHLLSELMNYFSKCEEELNNTIVEELLKHGFDKNLTEIEAEINLNDSSNSTCSDSTGNKKRVHFAPNFNDLMATIDNSTPSSLDSNISLDLKNELGACLKRLRDDANAILAASTNVDKVVEDEKQASLGESSSIEVLQDKIAQLTQQLDAESQIKKDLGEELVEMRKFADSLELERTNLDNHVELLVAKQKVLEGDLQKAREKIAEFVETGHKETVSEGYGQNTSNRGTHTLSSRIATLAELQERVRSMVAETANRVDHPLLQLVDELCREGDRITEEAKNDHEDLQQQIEAADKKLRATCHFLEEQASEREQERDEAQKQIVSLQEQLRDREKDRVSCERINKEIEQLEQQMREMSKLMDENEKKTNEIEAEKQEAIEKIYVLRDIIRDLETQVELKTNSEAELQTFISQLEEIIKQQNKTNSELTQNLSSIRNNSDSEDLQEIIKELEKEIKTLKINLEFAGSEGLFKQMKTQLNELEASIDKRTRDLEALHSAICATSCSSPSEDMSLRDQIRPKTPSALDECDIPLQQLARLKEKFVKHSRAEDAAVKRIRDLEMELVGLRHDLDDVQNERDILQDQVSEQLVLVSSLQMRLDDQRLRADHVQKQNNTSLELRIYDLENEIKSLIETVNARDKTIKHLNKIIEDTKKRLDDREHELDESFDEKVVLDLNKEIQKLRVENASLLTKINNDAQNAQVLPNLVDNILADKNKDIDLLREKLDKTQLELNNYLSLNLDFEQLKNLSRLPSSERAFADILSLIDVNSPENMRAEKANESLTNTVDNIPYKRSLNETTFLGSRSRFEPEISSIENLRKPPVYESGDAPLPKANSTEIHKTSEKRVHFEDTVYNDAIEKLQAEIVDLKNELFAKDEIVREYTERLDILKTLEFTIEELQKKLDSTETCLQEATKTFEKEQLELKEVEKNLRVDLAEKKMFLVEREKELKLLEEDAARKDQMYVNLAKDKRDLEKALNELKDNNERYKELDSIVGENEQEIKKLREQLGDVEKHLEKIKSLELQLNAKEGELKQLQVEYSKLQEEVDSKSSSLKEYQSIVKEQGDLNLKMQKEITNKESQLKTLNEQVEDLKKSIETKNLELQNLRSESREEDRKSLTQLDLKIKELKDVVVDRDTEIEILNEDITRYQDDLAKLEIKLKNSKKLVEGEYELKLAQNEREMAAKELKIVKLVTDLEDSSREINHLKQLVSKKDKIVSQMSDDTKSLHVNLETIQSKIQETGNVIDLRRRLEDEQELNRSLQQEVNSLKSLTSLDHLKPIDMSASIEEITGEVKKQLEYSEHLDSNILTALGSCENLGSLAESNDVELLKQTLSKEMYLNRDLNKAKEDLQAELNEFKQKLQIEQEKVYHLNTVMQDEKQRSNVSQLEDANMMEQLHIRLECALENQTEYEKLLDKEKSLRQSLEAQVEHLKSKVALSSGENSKTDLTEYKSLPNLQSQELLKIRNDLKVVQDDNVKLKSEVKSLKRSKIEIEASLKCTEDMLRFRNEEAEKSKADFDQMRKAESDVRENLILCKAELEQRNTEIENSRILMAELEQDRKDMKKVVEKLREKLLAAETKTSKMQEEQLQMPVPEIFLNKLKELNNSVKEFSKDNRQMANVIEKLTDERKALQSRINELEQMTVEDPVGKINHLLARYLRSESYRKALMWQKKYLVTLLATYQTYPVFSQEFPIPYQTEPIANRQTRSNGKQRFKAVAVSIVALIRMQFLVKRWNSGKRAFLANRRSSHRSPQTNLPSSSYLNLGAHFQVGQPVSSQNFPVPQVLTPTSINVRITNTPTTSDNQVFNFSPNHNQAATSRHLNQRQNQENVERPRTPPNVHEFVTSYGSTPPCKGPQGRLNNEAHSAPLLAPALLTQYIDRFDQIQHSLGVTVNKNS